MPAFLKEQVEGQRPDGYWVEQFPFHKDDKDRQNIVGYGLGTSEEASTVEMFVNPYKHASKADSDTTDWPKRQIAKLEFPVAFTYADITGNGFNDIILSDEYGPSMDDIWPTGGRVSWFENIGDVSHSQWKQRYIGRSAGMHRMRAGRFTTQNKVQVMAIPIVIKSSDLESPTPVIIFTAPDKPLEDSESGWPHEVAFGKNMFRLVHEATIIPGANNGLDKVLLAGREGVSLIWYDVESKAWESKNLGTGLPREEGNPFWGSGSVSLGKVHDDTYGYIGSCEAFHGNHVSVYVKDSDAKPNKLDVKWTRHVLEDFGPLNDKHTGSIHYVQCVDIDGDGVDELLVALMGSDPPSWEKTGVWAYKPVNLAKGEFKKFKLTDDSAGRIAVADFRGRGRQDIATISYSVPGYFESPSPAINAYFNTSIRAEKLQNELLFRVPHPDQTHLVDEVEFLDVSGKKLALVVLPPHAKYAIKKGEGVKVINGELSWPANGKTIKRTQSVAPFTASSIVVSNSADQEVKAGDAGALFMHLKHSATSGKAPFSDMKQLIAHNILPEYFPADVRHTKFPWNKVEDLEWAYGNFKGLEFYNLTGFSVKWDDDSIGTVCHIQLWTAGVGVSAGFHNHANQSFCEIHACIVNGTGSGGMAWADVPDGEFNPTAEDPTKYHKITVPDLSEHGPLWRTSADGLPRLRANDTVDYPWHAWIAGDKPQANTASTTQSFDVWLAFEFPAFVADTGPAITAASVSEGSYSIINAATKLALIVKGGDATDNTPIEASSEKQTWQVKDFEGTHFKILTNAITGSSAKVFWPPEAGQKLVGSHTPENMNLTSAWAIESSGKSYYRLRLIDTNLVLSVGKEDRKIKLETFREGSSGQQWEFHQAK